MSDTFNWKCQYAQREKKKGRASGGIITGVNKSIKELEVRDEVRGIQERRIELEDKTLKILAVYSREMKKIRENIEEAMTGIGEEKIIIGRDFNARTGREGSLTSEEWREREWRNSKDK